MPLPLALLISLAALLLGAFCGALLVVARGARAREALSARVAAAEATAQAAQQALAQAHAEQANREERDRQEQAVLRALAPLGESLAQMRRRVDELERERHEQFGTLAEQLRQAQASDEALRQTTSALAGALTSRTTRGVWGETHLRRVVEAAGLTRYVDFDLQQSISSDAGAGRPDMIIRLPGGRALAVDAKVPLDAFLEASSLPENASAEEGERRQALLLRHVRAVRAHVDALSKKEYWAGLDASPEFVICFLPSESLLATALEEDPALLDYAFAKRVALASPVNLWAVLKTVAFTWTQQDISEQAQELFSLGTQLYDRLGVLAGHADSLRRSIERTVDSYNRFAGTLESRVLVTARRFPGIDETKQDALTQPALIESTTHRLTSSELISHEDA